ncbi:hypothetical protein AX16_005981 [Volvariella volvacea WC 439]|nr:hypothetical protein AX16_005981 [Volvariella volvacea WC 439]
MMAILMPHHPFTTYPPKHIRRTATSVMAGLHDRPPPRDVLTSLLNGVPIYKVVERDEEAKRSKKREKKERDKERKRRRLEEKRTAEGEALSTTPNALPPSWNSRPAIYIPSAQRSVSVTPPPCTSPMRIISSSPSSTPGPSMSTTTSRTSSKRPRTPDDNEDLDIKPGDPLASGPPRPPQRKKRVAVKKGWKGWVEGSPPPSQKLINLDAAPVLQERRTRSGKNFDAISIGKDGWV